MQTYSHLIITAVANRLLKQGETNHGALKVGQTLLPPLRTRATLLGSVMPDVPLFLISLGAIIYDRARGNPIGFESDPSQSVTGYLFEIAFFHDPWVKSAHNLFHAPFMLLLYLAVGFWLWKNGRALGASLFWFSLSCLLHTALDIPIHTNDGPLLLFPFDLETRFYSPISYWDPRYYGRQFFVFEHLLILSLLVYLFVGRWSQRRSA